MAASDLIQSLSTGTSSTTFRAPQDFPRFTSTPGQSQCTFGERGELGSSSDLARRQLLEHHMGEIHLAAHLGSLWRHLRPVADTRSDCDRARREYVNRSDPHSSL